MTPERQRTIRRLAVSGVAFAASAVSFIAWVVWLLVIEGQAVAQGGESTISRVVWGAWASEPGAILLVTCVLWAIVCTIVGIAAFLAGHFFWQRKATYEAIRRGEFDDAILRGELGASRIACIAGVGLLALACMGAKASKPKRGLSLHVSPQAGIAQPWRPLTVQATARATGFTCPKFEWDCGQGATGSRASDCDPASVEPVVVDRRACIFFSGGDALVTVRASDSFGARVADALVLVR